MLCLQQPRSHAYHVSTVYNLAILFSMLQSLINKRSSVHTQLPTNITSMQLRSWQTHQLDNGCSHPISLRTCMSTATSARNYIANKTRPAHLACLVGLVWLPWRADGEAVGVLVPALMTRPTMAARLFAGIYKSWQKKSTTNQPRSSPAKLAMINDNKQSGRAVGKNWQKPKVRVFFIILKSKHHPCVLVQAVCYLGSCKTYTKHKPSKHDTLI